MSQVALSLKLVLIKLLTQLIKQAYHLLARQIVQNLMTFKKTNVIYTLKYLQLDNLILISLKSDFISLEDVVTQSIFQTSAFESWVKLLQVKFIVH